ncbi:MAG: molybdate ABC transporter substrate-binding protein [Myxococcota bacterium]
MIWRWTVGALQIRVLALTWGIAVSGLALGGCDETGREAASRRVERNPCRERPVRMGVASSLREIALDLALRFESLQPPVRVETTFGASSALARQLRMGAPIDLLVSADEELVRSLADRRLVIRDSLREIARGRLVLVTRTGSPFETLGLAALRSPRLKRLGLPAAAVPLGRYGRAWLERSQSLEGLEGKIVLTENARANLAAIDQGHVDLAILYQSDLRLGRAIHPIHRPELSEYPPIRYVAVRATRAPSCSEIDRVLEFWQSQSTRSHLVVAGFELPPELRPERPLASESER